MSYRVALVLKFLDEDYQAMIFNGALKQAKKLGIELICIQSEFFNGIENNSSFLLYQAKNLSIDGVIFLSSIISENDSVTIEKQLNKIFPVIPIVSIGVELDSIASVVCESNTAIKNLVEHLTLVHKYKKILYLGGPEKNQDNQKREKQISDAIKSHDKCELQIKNSTIFSESQGFYLIEQYCKQNKTKNIDAIIAGSDDMAIGIKKYINTLAPSSYKNCAITGFDDIRSASLKINSLTTINQPCVKMGQKAVSILYEILQGKKVNLLTKVPCKLILRNSCGCKKSQTHSTGEKDTVEKNIAEKEDETLLVKEQYLKDVNYFGQGLMHASNLEQLTSSLKEFLANVAVKDFSIYLSKSPLNIKKRNHDIQIVVNSYTNLVINYDTNLEKSFEIFSKKNSAKSNLLNSIDAKCFLHLKVGDKELGYISYSAKTNSHLYMALAGMFLSNAINRLYELEKEKNRADDLEVLVQKRTNLLKKESGKRRLVEQEILKISDLERQRFSLDLHDDICQRLCAMTMICKNSIKESSAIELLLKMSQDTLQKTREYAHNLFPFELQVADLTVAIKNLCEELKELHKTKIVFESDGHELDLIKEKKLNLFRIAQEAIGNALKYSKASVINCNLSFSKNSVNLIIEDNGVGYAKQILDTKRDSVNTRPKGLGLKSMEYRANQIGGSFSINSAKNKGTKIVVKIPAWDE